MAHCADEGVSVTTIPPSWTNAGVSTIDWPPVALIVSLAGAIQRPKRVRPRAVGLVDDAPPDLAVRDEAHLGGRA